MNLSMTRLIPNISGANRMLLVLVGALALAMPLFASHFYLRVFGMFFFALGLALSWNILGGYAGYWSFGHTVFIGVGAFSAGKLCLLLGPQAGKPFLFIAGIFTGGLVSALLALLLSYPLLRLRGIYFAIAMLGVAELGAELSGNLDVIGGGMGLMLPVVVPEGIEPAVFFYYIFLLMAAVILIICAKIKFSKFGYGLASIREDEDTAKMIGVPTETYKTFSFIISSTLIGMAGTIYGFYLGYFTTGSVIRVDFSLNMILHCLIGGIGTIAGPVVGAALMTFLTKVVLGRLLDVHILITGLLVITIVLAAPQGLVGTLAEIWTKRSRVLPEN